MCYRNVTLLGDFSIFQNVYMIYRDVVEYRKIVGNDDKRIFSAIYLFHKACNTAESIHIKSTIHFIEKYILWLKEA